MILNFIGIQLQFRHQTLFTFPLLPSPQILNPLLRSGLNPGWRHARTHTRTHARAHTRVQARGVAAGARPLWISGLETQTRVYKQRQGAGRGPSGWRDGVTPMDQGVKLDPSGF